MSDEGAERARRKFNLRSERHFSSDRDRRSSDEKTSKHDLEGTNKDEGDEERAMEPGSQKFRENDLVWAKVRGHAWWPALVGEIN